MKYGDFYVSTKVGLWHTTTADGVRKMVDKSLKTLNVPKITFYNMWCIKTMDDYRRMVAKGGMLDGIRKAKDEGLIEHICCTTHANGEDIAAIAQDGKVEGITLGYNAVNFAYRRKGIAACHAAGRGVVVMNPLGGGIIPNNPEHFGFLAESGEKLAVAALKFLVAHKEISVALPGISNGAEIDDAVSAVNNLSLVDDAYLDHLSKKLSVEMDTLCTGCNYCDGCPAGVEVVKLMDCYNNAILQNGDLKRTMSKLHYHWGLKGDMAKLCSECGKCEELCTQKLPIIERLRAMGNYKG
jgi:hypothetical protein